MEHQGAQASIRIGSVVSPHSFSLSLSLSLSLSPGGSRETAMERMVGDITNLISLIYRLIAVKVF
jgi:hypothetical protein